MDRKDLVEISEIYVKLHHLDKKDEDNLIEKINNSKEEELWSFLSTGGDFNNKLYEFEMGSWLADKSDKAIGKIWNYIYKDVTGGQWEDTKSTITRVYGDVTSGFNIGAKVVAVTILIALIIRASKMIRMKHLTGGSKECRGFSGIQKEICELKKEITVKRMELGVVKRGLDVCPSTKNPAECKQKLQHRLAGVKSDLLKKEANLKELMIKSRNKKR
jgi:hypothetical protein